MKDLDDDFKKPKPTEEDEDEEEEDENDPGQLDRMFCKPLPKSYFKFIENNKTFWRIILVVSMLT